MCSSSVIGCFSGSGTKFGSFSFLFASCWRLTCFENVQVGSSASFSAFHLRKLSSRLR